MGPLKRPAAGRGWRKGRKGHWTDRPPRKRAGRAKAAVLQWLRQKVLSKLPGDQVRALAGDLLSNADLLALAHRRFSDEEILQLAKQRLQSQDAPCTSSPVKEEASDSDEPSEGSEAPSWCLRDFIDDRSEPVVRLSAQQRGELRAMARDLGRSSAGVLLEKTEARLASTRRLRRRAGR